MIQTVRGPAERPLILTVPGLDGSGPDHWQTRWERELGDCARVDLGHWSRPHRNGWVNQLNLAIRNAGRPVLLVGHSLGCLAIAWWAALERPPYGEPVLGALLVAPPELDLASTDERLLPFAPTPLAPLPFPSILVASHDDSYIAFHRARRLAQFWGSELADAGHVGHINARSRLGGWDYGKALLARLSHGLVPSSVLPMEYASSGNAGPDLTI